VGLIGIGKKPTSDSDQYGLRRQTIAVQRLIVDRGYAVSLGQAIDRALVLLGTKVADPKKTKAETLQFFRDRLKNEWVESHRADVVEAVLAAGFDDIVAASQRLQALGKLVGQPGFDPLAVAFKRVVNIVQKQAAGVAKAEVDGELFAEEAERALWRSFLGLRSKVDAAAAAGDFELALQEITSLKPAVDLFFDKVLVMAEDSRVKDNRVRILREIGDMFNRVADFSQIQA
jgi:glycyl-tRNA synthetase beta chain